MQKNKVCRENYGEKFERDAKELGRQTEMHRIRAAESIMERMVKEMHKNRIEYVYFPLSICIHDQALKKQADIWLWPGVVRMFRNILANEEKKNEEKTQGVRAPQWRIEAATPALEHHEKDQKF